MENPSKGPAVKLPTLPPYGIQSEGCPSQTQYELPKPATRWCPSHIQCRLPRLVFYHLCLMIEEQASILT